MTSRDDVERLSGSARSVADLAIEELADFFFSLDLSSPALVRDALLEIVPEIVREFGPVAGTAAAEWFEDVRARQVGGSFEARLGPDVPPVAVEESVRWAAGALWTPEPTATLDLLSGSVQRHISYSSRSTVARNAEHDPLNPRFGRVPRGAKTCAWCAMLASRGFVYHSKKTAGEEPSDFHDDCDCAVVAEWDRDAHHIEGYDPDRLYDMYLEARGETGERVPTQKQIAAALRRLYPDEFKDGVHAPV